MKLKNKPILVEEKVLCCGCAACYAVCPQSAIMMIEDEEGFEYPEINDNCVACNLCVSVCPIKATLKKS